jgi:hypothetical protein
MDLVERLRENAGPSGEWGETADKLQIEAAEELARLRAENAALLDWVRVVGEETVLAGFPSGDRAQTLKNIRDLRAENAELKTPECVIRTAMLLAAFREDGAKEAGALRDAAITMFGEEAVQRAIDAVRKEEA